MTIPALLPQALKAYPEGMERYSAINIGYLDADNEEHETQLNVSERLDTPGGEKELCELFSSLCEEFATKEDKVTYVAIVATDKSEESLIKRGY